MYQSPVFSSIDMATSQANDGTTDPVICKPAQEEDNISVHDADDLPAELDARCEEMDVSHDDGSAGEHRDDAEDDDLSMDDDSSTISSESTSRDEESEWYPPTSDEESDDSSIGSIVSDDHSASVNVPRSLKWKKDSPPCPIGASIDATDTFVGSGDICVGHVPGPDGKAICLIEAVDMALQNIRGNPECRCHIHKYVLRVMDAIRNDMRDPLSPNILKFQETQNDNTVNKCVYAVFDKATERLLKIGQGRLRTRKEMGYDDIVIIRCVLNFDNMPPGQRQDQRHLL